MVSGEDFAALLERLGITHVVWVPDSTVGRWEAALESSPSIRLVRVCREGEAWVVAGGLWLGGANPIVVIQCTGFFESGDALRNVLHDYRLPIYAIVGCRSYLNDSTLPGDTARTFSEPLLAAWDLDWQFVKEPSQFASVAEHRARCLAAGRPGVTLLAEGRA